MSAFKKYCHIALILFIGSFACVQAQKDTISTAIITDIEQLDNSTIDFTLNVIRDTDAWRVWANGTYQFTIDAFPNINPQNQTIEYIGSSQLNLALTPVLTQPMKGYLITSAVLNGRISITIIGPDEYGDGMPIINTGDLLTLGRFRLKAVQGPQFPEPVYLNWYAPYPRFQAHAYKIQGDSISNGAQWFYANDNVEMDNSTTAVRYKVDNPKIIPTNDINFTAKYRGSKSVELTWNTTDEFYNKGFILRRGMRAPEGNASVAFDTEIGNFAQGINNASSKHAALLSKSIKGKGADYKFIDTVTDRGEEYVYELIDVSGAESILAKFPSMHDRDTAKVVIPFSVISSAKAGPNPFQNSATIVYYLEDDMRITITVSDLIGKQADRLLNNEFQKKGEHTIVYNVGDLASNGLYNVIITGNPINDTSVEVSRAVLKIQLVR